MQDHQQRRQRGKGIGTVIACFAAAIVIGGIIGHDHKPRQAKAREAATETAVPTPPSDGRLSYRVNKGHIIVVSTTGPGKVELGEDVRDHAKVTSEGSQTTIKVEDDYSGDSKIKILIPKTGACRVELAAGLLEAKGLPCAATEFIVRSGKMEVDDVPRNHGALVGQVSVGTVTIEGADGKTRKSSGVGDLRAEVPAAGQGPSLNARVDVGMLTVKAE